MMRRTEMTRKVPMSRGKPLKSNQNAKSRFGLAQRVAQLVGTAIQHEHSEPSVFRSVQHRMNVAALECACCGIEKYSQCAHLNLLALGKGKGLKVSDALSVPLCCSRPGIIGCHVRLDSSGEYDKATAATLQLTWLHNTRDTLIRQGQWPDAAEADLVRIVGSYLARAA